MHILTILYCTQASRADGILLSYVHTYIHTYKHTYNSINRTKPYKTVIHTHRTRTHLPPPLFPLPTKHAPPSNPIDPPDSRANHHRHPIHRIASIDTSVHPASQRIDASFPPFLLSPLPLPSCPSPPPSSASYTLYSTPSHPLCISKTQPPPISASIGTPHALALLAPASDQPANPPTHPNPLYLLIPYPLAPPIHHPLRL